MRVAGTPSDWANLIDSMVPDILDLVLAAWDAMPPPAPNVKEDSTTQSLCICLRQGRNRCELPFQIHTQLVELEPAAGADLGRMDVVFSPPVPRENIYFCLECKRLNVVEGGRTRAYASEYIHHGMMRFVRGQYAAIVRHGGMLGYVLDGDLPSALANVEANIRTHHAELGMGPPGAFQDSSVRPGNSRVRETHHRRAHDPGLFRVHHLFVAGAVKSRPTVTTKPDRERKKPTPPTGND